MVVHPTDITRRKHFQETSLHEDLLVPIMRQGKLVYNVPELPAIRERARQQLAMLHPGIKRLANPHQYPAGLEKSLHELKTALVLKARGENKEISL
jgi:nicotinate phosphoribosyltransferase